MVRGNACSAGARGSSGAPCLRAARWAYCTTEALPGALETLPSSVDDQARIIAACAAGAIASGAGMPLGEPWNAAYSVQRHLPARAPAPAARLSSASTPAWSAAASPSTRAIRIPVGPAGSRAERR